MLKSYKSVQLIRFYCYYRHLWHIFPPLKSANRHFLFYKHSFLLCFFIIKNVTGCSFVMSAGRDDEPHRLPASPQACFLRTYQDTRLLLLVSVCCAARCRAHFSRLRHRPVILIFPVFYGAFVIRCWLRGKQVLIVRWNGADYTVNRCCLFSGYPRRGDRA